MAESRIDFSKLSADEQRASLNKTFKEFLNLIKTKTIDALQEIWCQMQPIERNWLLGQGIKLSDDTVVSNASNNLIAIFQKILLKKCKVIRNNFWEENTRLHSLVSNLQDDAAFALLVNVLQCMNGNKTDQAFVADYVSKIKNSRPIAKKLTEIAEASEEKKYLSGYSQKLAQCLLKRLVELEPKHKLISDFKKILSFEYAVFVSNNLFKKIDEQCSKEGITILNKNKVYGQLYWKFIFENKDMLERFEISFKDEIEKKHIFLSEYEIPVISGLLISQKKKRTKLEEKFYLYISEALVDICTQQEKAVKEVFGLTILQEHFNNDGVDYYKVTFPTEQHREKFFKDVAVDADLDFKTKKIFLDKPNNLLEPGLTPGLFGSSASERKLPPPSLNTTPTIPPP